MLNASKWTAGAMLLAMACTGNKTVTQGEAAAEDSAVAEVPVSDTLVFETIDFVDSMSYKIKVVDYSGDEEPYPYTIETVTDYCNLSTLEAVAGKPEAVEFVNQWLTLDAAAEMVEAPVTAEKVAKKYAELKKQGITDVRSAFKDMSGKRLAEEDIMPELGFASANEYEANVFVNWQAPNVLTLWDGGYEYFAGGAHGMPWGIGRTFDLKNLRVLTLDDIVAKEGRKAVLKMIVAQLQEEYGDTDMLNAPDDIDFPGADPSLMKEGVSFDYGAYEIGPYALGMPGVIISYEKMKPYLTPEVKELLEME
jgi:hypothetical protein